MWGGIVSHTLFFLCLFVCVFVSITFCLVGRASQEKPGVDSSSQGQPGGLEAWLGLAATSTSGIVRPG